MQETLAPTDRLLSPTAAAREFAARLEAVAEIAGRLQPDQPIPDDRLRHRQDEIARYGESAAAWAVYAISARLEAAKELAILEGLLGLAVTMERAIRLLDRDLDLYAFAGRDDAETDPLVAAAIQTDSGPVGFRGVDWNRPGVVRPMACVDVLDRSVTACGHAWLGDVS